MKNIAIFLLGSSLLFLVQFLLERYVGLSLSYNIHFLIFFITFICILTTLLIDTFVKKGIVGFLFLGFVLFKLFAIGYIAIFQKDFRENVLYYFSIYWLYLIIEVLSLVGLMKKQDEYHRKK